MTDTSIQQSDAFLATTDPDQPIDSLLGTEWLLTNGTGSYSSATIAGINTRRYHGLLIAAARPPLARINMLAGLGETLTIAGESFELFAWEFADAFHPQGFNYLRTVQVDSAVHMLYQIDQTRIEKTISLLPGQDTLVVRYRIEPGQTPWQLALRPFVALRDFHSLRSFFIDDQMVIEGSGEQISVHDRLTDTPTLYMRSPGSKFQPAAHWWYKFHYRKEAQRGQDCFEDLFVPGDFVVSGSAGAEVVFIASLDEHPDAELPEKSDQTSAQHVSADEPAVRRLFQSADAFIARRSLADRGPRATILAGFHWFGDWGRDAFISLPGLLLLNRRFALAREVFETFAAALSEGMIPNCFDDYDSKPAYNSVDASLWFVHAADLYLQATNDADTWKKLLAPAVCKILDAYETGTRFGIHADQRGLIVCGDQNTQLTWMDTQCNGQCFTPRPGAAVEVNALWHSVLRRMAERLAGDDPDRAGRYSALADKAALALQTEFWNPHGEYLYDFIANGQPNADLRPNQIFAVSLPCSPLTAGQQKSVVEVVQRHLLTPFGLRSLDRENYQYRCSCDADPFSRDSAYHQGTVWAWLIGPFVEAYLNVHHFSLQARQQAKQMIQPLFDHLDKAGVGFISEIFDGDPPHTPRGCIAQAWSVAELLRAHALIFS